MDRQNWKIHINCTMKNRTFIDVKYHIHPTIRIERTKKQIYILNVNLVFEGDRVEDDALYDDLQLGFDQGLDIGNFVLQHLLLLRKVPFHQTRTDQEESGG